MTRNQADTIKLSKRGSMTTLARRLWAAEQGQDIAEYAVMLAMILVLVIGTVRLIGTNANNAYSSVASTLQ
jgi:Flp pilus assembly pilin Flp